MVVLESIKQLAKSHKLMRQILGKRFLWNKGQELSSGRLAADNYPDLASVMAKVRLLTGILSLSEDLSLE